MQPPKADGLLSCSDIEQSAGHDSMETPARKASDACRHKISVVAYRKKPIKSVSQLCVAYFIDALRYCGLIEDDSLKHIVVQVEQRKVWSKSCERTEILIEPLIE